MSRAATASRGNGHGGRIADACARFGGRRDDWLDLSTGINPCPWPIERAPLPNWSRLPDPEELARLEAIAGHFFGVDPQLCMALPGSEVALRALGMVLGLPGRHRALTYSTHAEAFARSSGGKDADVLVLANPNNPDGLLLDPETLAALLEEQEAGGGWLLVDEAFVECHPGSSVAALVGDDRSLVVTRSFGKFFGLPGLRLGFVLGPCALLRKLRALCGDWPVSAAALAFASAAYADDAWIAATRADLSAKAATLDALLARHGLAARGASPLFRLVEDMRAGGLFEALGRRHILTRSFADHPRLLRFGLPRDEAQAMRLDNALGQVLRRG